MAKDILSLGTDGEEEITVPAVVDATKPRPVPDLDDVMPTLGTTAGSPMAPDFFTSSRVKSKKRIWRFAR